LPSYNFDYIIIKNYYKKPRCCREYRAMPLAVHFDTYRILQRHRAVSLSQHGFPV